MQNIEWRKIKGFEGLYEISNTGMVKSLPRLKHSNNGDYYTREKILKQTSAQGEYYRVPLTDKNHIKKYFLVHRLIAQAFIDNPNNLQEVNHKDGNKLNNNINNLEWCDRKYNVRHAYKMGLNPSRRKIIEYISSLEDRIEKLETKIKSIEYEVE